MTECQALLATAFEVAATYVQSHEQSGVNCNWRGMADTIRDFTNADAQAALDARINAAKEEGRVMGLREAAALCDDTAQDALEESGAESRAIWTWFRGQRDAILAAAEREASP